MHPGRYNGFFFQLYKRAKRQRLPFIVQDVLASICSLATWFLEDNNVREYFGD